MRSWIARFLGENAYQRSTLNILDTANICKSEAFYPRFKYVGMMFNIVYSKSHANPRQLKCFLAVDSIVNFAW